MARAVGAPDRNVGDALRAAGIEQRQAIKSPVAVVLIRGQVSHSLVAKLSADLNSVAALRPNQVVALGEFVLDVLEIGNDAGSNGGQARHGDESVLAILSWENLQRGCGWSGRFNFGAGGTRKRSAERVDQVGRENMALLESGKLILAIVVRCPQGNLVRVAQVATIGKVAGENGVFVGDHVIYAAQKIVFLRGLIGGLKQISGAVAQIHGGQRVQRSHRSYGGGSGTAAGGGGDKVLVGHAQ